MSPCPFSQKLIGQVVHDSSKRNGKAVVMRIGKDWHWFLTGFRNCSSPIFVTLARMCHLVVHSSVYEREIHESPASKTPEAVVEHEGVLVPLQAS